MDWKAFTDRLKDTFGGDIAPSDMTNWSPAQVHSVFGSADAMLAEARKPENIQDTAISVFFMGKGEGNLQVASTSSPAAVFAAAWLVAANYDPKAFMEVVNFLLLGGNPMNVIEAQFLTDDEVKAIKAKAEATFANPPVTLDGDFPGGQEVGILTYGDGDLNGDGVIDELEAIRIAQLADDGCPHADPGDGEDEDPLPPVGEPDPFESADPNAATDAEDNSGVEAMAEVLASDGHETLAQARQEVLDALNGEHGRTPAGFDIEGDDDAGYVHVNTKAAA
jgi:hypothetical protein